jgi:uncharacterized membrane protein
VALTEWVVVELGFGDLYENLSRNSKFGQNGTKMSGTLQDFLSVFHSARIDTSNAKTQSSHGCPSMASLSVFVTLLTATSVHQKYKGNALLRFCGYNVHANAPE